MRNTLRILLLPPLLWVSSAIGLDLYGAEDTPIDRFDLIIVAGCRVYPDGRPSPALARRTRKAVQLWERGLASHVVFTGGLGTYAPTEATAASRYARELGLPEAAILLEDSSTSTEENARFASEHYPAERVLVVSDTYHIFRIERVFGRYYREVRGVGSTPLPWWRTRGSLREVAAVGWYGLRGRL